jgi:hypothetical protein
MRPEAIKQAADAKPFIPFTIHLADGREAHVPARDFVAIHPNQRTVIVMTDEFVRLLDMTMITEITLSERAA